MATRKTGFADDEYYHLVNRGVGKKRSFNDRKDYARFLLLVLFCQSPTALNNPGFAVKDFLKTDKFHISQDLTNQIIKERYVELVSFCLMPNHFHLLVKQTRKGGISKYMQRVQNAYTKYFNTKNKTTGHLFQGPFRAVWVEDNDQLLYLSAYIHKNPVELTGPQGKEYGYQWSSLTDYLNKNRWPTSLLKPEIILEQFNNKQEYQDWIKQSYAKLQDIGCPVVKI